MLNAGKDVKKLDHSGYIGRKGKGRGHLRTSWKCKNTLPYVVYYIMYNVHIYTKVVHD